MVDIPPILSLYIEGLHNHDTGLIAQTVDNNLKFISQGKTLNKIQFLTMVEALYTGFPDWHYEGSPPRRHDDGSWAILWKQGGTHTRVFSMAGMDPIEPTGKTVAIPPHHFFYQVQNGQIIVIKPDPVPGAAPRGILEQLGIASPPL